MTYFVTKIMVPLCFVFCPDDRVWFAVFESLCRHFLPPQGILIMLMKTYHHIFMDKKKFCGLSRHLLFTQNTVCISASLREGVSIRRSVRRVGHTWVEFLRNSISGRYANKKASRPWVLKIARSAKKNPSKWIGWVKLKGVQLEVGGTKSTPLSTSFVMSVYLSFSF